MDIIVMQKLKSYTPEEEAHKKEKTFVDNISDKDKEKTNNSFKILNTLFYLVVFLFYTSIPQKILLFV